MVNNYKGAITAIVPTLLIAIAVIRESKAQTIVTFTCTETMQTFTVPNCVGALSFTVSGAQGSSNSAQTVAGGLGGSAYGSMTVTPGTVLNIFVGGMKGYNGGGAPGSSPCGAARGGNGGGASDIRMGGTALYNRIIVGGGGGGAGGDRVLNCGRGTGGGGGGGYYGGGGGAGWGSTVVPTGGSQTAGGTGGTSSSTYNGVSGSTGFGGHGGNEVSSYQVAGALALTGGAGGGSNGGSGQYFQSWTGQSGGGGSSHTGSMVIGAYTTSGNRTGNGIIIISYNSIQPMITATSVPPQVCTGNSATLSASGMSSYTWTPGGPGPIVVSPASTTNYTVTGTNTLGCNQLSVITVTVNTSAPTLTITSTTATVCSAHKVILTASGANTFSWTGGISNGVQFYPSTTSGYTVTGTNGCGTVTSVAFITVNPIPVISIVHPTVLCSSRPATLTAGGAANYTWMPGNLTGTSIVVSPNQATTYSVTGVLGGCTGSTNIHLAIVPNPTIAATANFTNVCEGKPVTLNASGANQYTWTPGGMTGSTVSVNPLTSTLFTVTGVDPFGCRSTANQVVVVKAGPPVMAVTNRPFICAGNSATLSANGAHTYQWSTGSATSSQVVNPLANTVYSVVGTHSATGCSKTGTVSVKMFTTGVIASGAATICAGDFVNLKARGAGSYTWSDGQPGPNIFVTPSVSTVYTVNAITYTLGMACMSSNSVAVTVNPLPIVSAAASRTAICRNENSILTAGGASTYTWSNFNTTPTFTLRGATYTTHIFTVKGTDKNGCVNTATAEVKVTPCTSLEEHSTDVNVNVYPNPSHGKITVFVEEPAKQQIQVYNIVGALIKTEEVNDQNTIVDLDQEVNGFYFVRITEGDGRTQTIRIIKN